MANEKDAKLMPIIPMRSRIFRPVLSIINMHKAVMNILTSPKSMVPYIGQRSLRPAALNISVE